MSATSKTGENRFERIKNFFLNKWFIAIIAIIAAVIFFVSELKQSVAELVPNREMAVQFQQKHLQAGILETLRVNVGIVVSSEKQFLMKDGIVTLQFFVNEKNRLRAVNPERCFAGDFSQSLATLDNGDNKTSANFSIRTKVAGNYIIVVTGSSTHLHVGVLIN